MTVSMHEAKTHFSKLVKRALEGEEITVTNRGKPMVSIVPARTASKTRNAGFFKATRPIFSDEEWQQMKDDTLDDFESKDTNDQS